MATSITKAAKRSGNGSARKFISKLDLASAVAPSRPTPDEIRVLAYHKWVAAGYPSGDGEHFWLEAERELGPAHGIDPCREEACMCAEG